MIDKNKKYPEGHFLGVGMATGIAIFSGIGIALSTSTGNPGLIGIGPAIGILLGLAIGKSMEEKYKKQGLIRPLTAKEKASKKKSEKIGLLVAAIGILVFVLLLILL